MFDFLFDVVVEGIADLVGDLFGGGADAVADSAANAPVDLAAFDSSAGGDGWLAANDGGISSDSFDPKPPVGPYTP